MKKPWSREIALLTLPVFLIGGVALLKMTGHLGSKNPFDPGPLRIEYSPFVEAEVSPLDVSRGYTWKAKSDVEVVGQAAVPKSWRFRTRVDKGFKNLRIVYRQGAIWKQLPGYEKGTRRVDVHSDSNTHEYSFLTNLESVPRNAQEVRLRGQFEWAWMYQGTFPSGWKPPRGLKTYGVYHELPLETKPFDMVIKSEDEPMPNPKISVETPIELREAKWFLLSTPDGKRNSFFLHLRHHQNSRWDPSERVVQNLRVFDADGRKLKLYYLMGAGSEVQLDSFNGRVDETFFSPRKQNNDLILNVIDEFMAPEKGWNSCKQPIRIEVEISDGKCWPTKIKANFGREDGSEAKLREFGAPEN